MSSIARVFGKGFFRFLPEAPGPIAPEPLTDADGVDGSRLIDVPPPVLIAKRPPVPEDFVLTPPLVPTDRVDFDRPLDDTVFDFQEDVVGPDVPGPQEDEPLPLMEQRLGGLTISTIAILAVAGFFIGRQFRLF